VFGRKKKQQPARPEDARPEDARGEIIEKAAVYIVRAATYNGYVETVTCYNMVTALCNLRDAEDMEDVKTAEIIQSWTRGKQIIVSFDRAEGERLY
jgi:hypothetical protein